MRKFLFILVSLVLLFSVNINSGWAAEQATSYSRTQTLHTVFEHAKYEYYFNNSGSTIYSGWVVVFDTSGTGVDDNITEILATEGSASRNVVPISESNQTTIGYFITTTSSADSVLVAGVVDEDSCADQTMCRVQVYGPRVVRCAESTDGVTSGSAVGTANGVTAEAGGGNGLGVAIGSGNGLNDNDLEWIWIDVGGNR